MRPSKLASRRCLWILGLSRLANAVGANRVARELGETGLEEEELRAMIEEFDLDGTGGVGKEAFVGICLQ